MTLNLENGKTLRISAPENSDANRYIRSFKVNGKKYDRNYLKYEDILKGGKFVFDMDSVPNMNRGTDESAFPYSFSREDR